MGLPFDDMTNHDPLGVSTEVVDLFHFKPSHGEAVFQRFHGFIHLDELFQPGKGHPHGFEVNWARDLRKRPCSEEREATG